MSFDINGLRFNFRDFLVIKLRYSLPFNALYVNNSVDFLETRLRTCLCALSLSGLRLQARLPLPIPANANRKEQMHFISQCGPCAEDFTILSMLIPSRSQQPVTRKNLSVRPTSTDEKFPGSTAKQTILDRVENRLYQIPTNLLLGGIDA